VQAPLDLTNQADTNNTYTGAIDYDWSANGYSFLPDFKEGTANNATIEQYVYQIYADSGVLGGIYLAEPAVNHKTNHIVFYDAMNIRFHYPSEHYLNGTRYDLEMQIFGNDTFNRALGCFSHHAAVSILFQLDASSAPHEFFNWQPDAIAGNPITIDLSLYLNKVSGSTTSIAGYMGSDTMPGCTYGTCWYIVNTVQTINQSELDFFLVPDVSNNARMADTSAATSWTQTFFNYGLFAPINP